MGAVREAAVGQVMAERTPAKTSFLSAPNSRIPSTVRQDCPQGRRPSTESRRFSSLLSWQQSRPSSDGDSSKLYFSTILLILYVFIRTPYEKSRLPKAAGFYSMISPLTRRPEIVISHERDREG